MSEQVEHLLSLQCKLGEGPRWDVESQRLYWVDIQGHAFFRMNVATMQYDRFETGMAVGVLAVRENGGVVMATKHGFAFWDEQGQKLDFIADPEADKPENRFNDGLVDVQGRFWAGTMNEDEDDPTPRGSLYRLDPDGTVTKHEKNLFISNGLGFSPDNRTMYLADSPPKIIYAYDFDAATGEISNRRIFSHLPEEDNFPDGLTVDSEGYVWSARWNGGKIMRFDPDGKLEREIAVPEKYPSCCVFGGPDLTDLYITTARKAYTAEELPQHPTAGDLFRLKTDIKGLPGYRFKG